MKKTHYGLIALCLLLCSATAAPAQVSIGISTPNVSIGINLPLFPELVPVPGYPVYYAPTVAANYFFYDGMYWVFYDDNWYASYWYNGPWTFVEPVFVPVFILRIPVRYYVRPPAYFHGWRPDAYPRWDRHWGPKWGQHRRGWDRWNRAYVPARAPLPVYQRRYSGDRYPRYEQQQSLQRQNYRHQPRNDKVRRIYQQQLERRAPASDQRRQMQKPPARAPQQRDIRPAGKPRQVAPAAPRPKSQPRGREDSYRSAPPQQRSPSYKEKGQMQKPRVRAPQQRDIRPAGKPRQVAPAAPRPKSQPRGREDSYRSAPPQQRSPSYKEKGQQPRGVQGEQRAPKQQERGKPQRPGKGGGKGDKRTEDGGRDRGK